MFHRLLVLLAALIPASEARAVPFCDPVEGREAARFRGELSRGDGYARAFSGGWTFALMPNRYGWSVRIFDENGLDLSQITPPYRGAPNARDIMGWHFRNADNSGPNEGSVNAPQKMRLFFFDPALTGTGGFKPSAVSAPADGPGRAALEIDGMTLTPPEKGERAALRTLTFDACLSWPITGRTRQPSAETVEQMRACGLPEVVDIVWRTDPETLGGDIDGDGSLDVVAQIRRRSDGKNGIAVCRAGTWIHSIGISDPLGELDPAYLESMTYWGLHEGPISQGVTDAAPPVPKGDSILLGKEGASSVLVYWNGTGFASYWQGD